MKKLIFIALLFLSVGAFAQSATATITATASDSDGTISSYNWTKISGNTCTISGASTSAATITFTQPGTYTFQCQVTDNGGATSAATATVTVIAANIPPKVVINPSTITVQLK